MSGYDPEERRGRVWPQPTREQIADTARAMADADPRVDAAYLFGSHAAGDVRPTSDVDFAVLLDAAELLDDTLSVQHPLEEVAEERLCLPVDVVVLRWDLTPSLLFEIFRVETILFARDRDRAHLVACRARAEYRDELPRLERARDRMHLRTKDWGNAAERTPTGTASTSGDAHFAA